MNTSKQPLNSIPPAPSGFSILVRSRPVRFLLRLWIRLNDIARPLLPLLSLFMLLVTGIILAGIIFVNQHLPCWFDEICMLDPAYHRTNEGVWRSIAQWDSINVVPFAPNYPLLINLLWLLIACFGVNFWILRGTMLALGVGALVFLLVFSRKTGLSKSWLDILYITYFSVCCSFCFWAISIRPESVLLVVLTIVIFAWRNDRPILLFFSAFLVPLCGLQWAVLLVAVFFHWLVFGGRIRKLVLVTLALSFSVLATYAVYHLLGMWPSYVQEAARVGGLGIFRNAVARSLSSFLKLDFGWLISPWSENPAFAWSLLLFSCGTLVGGAARMDIHTKKCLLFPFLLQFSIWGPMALFANVNYLYLYLAPLPLAFSSPLWCTPLRRQAPAFFAILILAAAGIGFTHWKHICKWGPNNAPSIAAATWLDEFSLEQTLTEVLPPETKFLGHDSAYFAIRSKFSDFWSDIYAFDLPTNEVMQIGAVLLKDTNISFPQEWIATWRRSSFVSALTHRYPGKPHSDITSDDCLAAIADCWHCNFTEIPLPRPISPRTIRYRLFRPVFRAAEGVLSDGNVVSSCNSTSSE